MRKRYRGPGVRRAPRFTGYPCYGLHFISLTGHTLFTNGHPCKICSNYYIVWVNCFAWWHCFFSIFILDKWILSIQQKKKSLTVVTEVFASTDKDAFSFSYFSVLHWLNLHIGIIYLILWSNSISGDAVFL